MRSQLTRDRWFVALIVAAFVYGFGPSTVQSFTAPKYQTDIGVSIPMTKAASTTTTYTFIALVAIALLIILLSVARIPTQGRFALAALLAPWFYLVIRDKYLGVGLHVNFIVYPLLCVAVWFLRPRIAALQWLGYVVGGAALLAMAMGQFLPAKGIYQAASGGELSTSKAIFSSGLLVGPLTSGNNLGQFLVMGLASVLLIRSSIWRPVLLVAVLVASVWAASRSCLGATLVLLVLAAALSVTPVRSRASLITVTLVPMLALVVTLPLITTSRTAFTNRGYIWIVSKNAWDAHRWLGLGSDFYSRIAKTSQNLGGSVFHAHNQFMQSLVLGGIVLAILLGLVLVLEINAAAALARRGINFPGIYLVGFLGACLLEVSYVLVDRYWALSVMVLPFACILFTVDHELPKASDVRETRTQSRGTIPPRAKTRHPQAAPGPTEPVTVRRRLTV